MESNKERSKSEQTLIDRYVYDVIRRLPRKMRADIELELRGLIEDMLEEDPEADLHLVLEQLGPPALLARRYRGEDHGLIGPELWDSYYLILRLVCFGLLIGFGVTTILRASSLENGQTMFVFFGSQLASLVMSIFSAGGFVTLIFALLERFKIRVDLEGQEDWKPESCPPIPDKKGIISRGETVTGIVFLLIFMSLLLIAPDLLGAWHKDAAGVQVRPIPVFNLDIWPSVMPLFILGFGLSFLDEIVKLIAGRYCVAVAINTTVCNVASVAVAALLLRGFPLWNPDFVTQIEQAFSIQISSSQDILSYWNTPLLSNIFLALITLGAVIDITTAIYKTARYGSR